MSETCTALIASATALLIAGHVVAVANARVGAASVETPTAVPSGVDLRERDLTGRPGDDFIEYALGNIDAWYAAFDVRAYDRNFLSPEQRVRIW
jgi:hypothetical protein